MVGFQTVLSPWVLGDLFLKHHDALPLLRRQHRNLVLGQL